MKRSTKSSAWLTVLAGVVGPLSGFLLGGCGGNGSPLSIAGITQGGASRQYVGSEKCKTCHPQAYADEQNMGHPYKLNKVTNGVRPTFPSQVKSMIPNPPGGKSWNDISYVIGGYGWKARFIDQQGYIITGSSVQYNLENRTWSAYETATPEGTKPYDCGACHTTGWVATGAAGPHQDNLPGMYGTWSEPGVRCEACHGGGSVHVVTQSRADINLGDGKTECAGCHNRSANLPIEASGGFIQHHEQWEELSAAGHSALKCTDCHDPHQGPHYEGAQPGALVRQCSDCHPRQASANNHLAGLACEDCHMPKASKSAIKINDFQADLHTHLFAINTNPVGKNGPGGFLTADGKFVDTSSGKGAVTLDLVCYGCHTDPLTSTGGGGSQRTLAELSAKATGIHD